MKYALVIGAAAAAFAGTAQAEQLVLDGVIGRVEVITESRADIAVSVQPGAGLPAPRVTRTGGRVTIDGGFDDQVRNCNTNSDGMTVELRGGGREIHLSQGPVITVRAPRALSLVSRKGAVMGRVGSAQDLSITSGGCSVWSVGNVAGTLRLDQSGGANVRAGDVRVARFSASGGGNIRADTVSSLDAEASGGAQIRVGRAVGPTELDASGGAQVHSDQGRTGLLKAHASGAGVIRYGGSADQLDASASGAAHVRVAQVTGQVIRRSASGMGSVEIGR